MSHTVHPVLHSRIGHRYETIRVLQQREGCTAYQARDLATGATVFLKVVPRRDVEALHHEAMLSKRVLHPALSFATDFGVSNEEGFVVQRFVSGVSLGEVLSQNVSSSEKWQVPATDGGLAWARQIAGALASLHTRGIVHGDVKPENILVSPQKATLLDFGLSGYSGEARRGGTPNFLAPEARTKGVLEPASDVYAFAKTFAPFVSGFRGANLRKAQELMRLSLEHEPSLRPNAEELVTQLGGVWSEDRRRRFAGLFVGRTGELDRLRTLVAEGERAKKLVVITGPRGIGKTRLLNEWADLVRPHHPLLSKHPRESFFAFLARVANKPVRSPIDFESIWNNASEQEKTLVLVDELDHFHEDETDLFCQWIDALPENWRVMATARDASRWSQATADILPLRGISDIESFMDSFPDSRAEIADLARERSVSPGDIERIVFQKIETKALPAAFAPISSQDFVSFSDVDALDPSGALLERALSDGQLTYFLDGLRWIRTDDSASRHRKYTDLPSPESLDFDPFQSRDLILNLRLDTFSELHAASYFYLRIGNTSKAWSLGLRALRLSKGPERTAIRLTLIEIDARLGHRRALRTISAIPKDSPARTRAELDGVIVLLKHSRFEEAMTWLDGIDPSSLPARLKLEWEISRSLAASWLGKPVTPLLTHEPLSRDVYPPRTRFRAYHASAILAQRENRLDIAETMYRMAIQIAKEESLSDLLVSSTLGLATLYHLRGNLGQALDTYRSAERVARIFSNAHATLSIRINQLKLLLEMGAFEELRRATEEVPEFSSDLQGAQWWSIVAEGELLRDDYDAALSSMSKAQAFGTRANAKAELTELALLAAEIRLYRGENVPLPEVSAELDIATRGRALRLHAIRSMRLGHTSEAVRFAKEAESAFEQSQEDDERAQIILLLSRLVASSGAERLAAQYADRAQLLWEERLASLDEPYRTSFKLHPRRREVWQESARPKRSKTDGAPAGLPIEEIFHFISSLVSAPSERELFRTLIEYAVRSFQVERAFVLLANPQGGTRVECSKNIDQEEVKKAKHKFSRSLAEKVIRSGEPYLSGNATLDAPENAARSVHIMQLRSVLIVPLTAEETLGALYLDNRFRENVFGEQERRHALWVSQLAAACAKKLRTIETLGKTRSNAPELAAVEADSGASASTLAMPRSPFPEYVTSSASVIAVLESVSRVASTDVPVLVRGESGTGKERIARILHDRSSRAKGPFVAINCAAMPESLLEAELFGYMRGSFTGANEDKRGLFVVASNGTLFLDEIGEMPLSMQAKLLRVLQENEVRPIGSEETIPIRTRVVSATNRNLKAEISSGRFREDLYYRVAVVDFSLPPLRERREDVLLLARHFLDRLNREFQKNVVFDRHTLGRLVRHSWPGNVRELENALRRGFVLCDGDVLRPNDLMLEEAVFSQQRTTKSEKQWILSALERSGWNAQQTAKALGIPRASFYRKLKKYGIDRPKEE